MRCKADGHQVGTRKTGHEARDATQDGPEVRATCSIVSNHRTGQECQQGNQVGKQGRTYQRTARHTHHGRITNPGLHRTGVHP